MGDRCWLVNILIAALLTAGALLLCCDGYMMTDPGCPVVKISTHLKALQTGTSCVSLTLLDATASGSGYAGQEDAPQLVRHGADAPYNMVFLHREADDIAAVSTDEVTATARHNAESARKAHELTGRTLGVTRPEKEIGQSVIRYHRCYCRAEKFPLFTATIKGIAFLANIPGLNFILKAARTGSRHATEVRSFAQRTSAASKVIQN